MESGTPRSERRETLYSTNIGLKSLVNLEKYLSKIGPLPEPEDGKEGEGGKWAICEKRHLPEEK